MIVEYEKRGRTAVITLNRPEARNAVSGELAQALEEAIDKLEADDDVCCLLYTSDAADE